MLKWILVTIVFFIIVLNLKGILETVIEFIGMIKKFIKGEDID